MIKYVKHFEHNTVGRDFVVGDIHGCVDSFKALLTHVNFDRSVDRVFSVGDLIDRGPNSVEALQLLDNDWFHAVRGNHEQMMWDAIMETSRFGQSLSMWIANGGKWISDLLNDEAKAAIYLCDTYVADLPYIITVGSGSTRFNIVHAECVWSRTPVSDYTIDNVNLPTDALDSLIWGRSMISGGSYDQTDLSTTYVGHTPVQQIEQVGNQIYLDTGAVYANGHFDGKLTLLDTKTNIAYHHHRLTQTFSQTQL